MIKIFVLFGIIAIVTFIVNVAIESTKEATRLKEKIDRLNKEDRDALEKERRERLIAADSALAELLRLRHKDKH